MKKAYTLVEIMIVMTIIAILIALGTAGLIRLRRTMEADQAGKNLISVLKESETMAKNNTLDAKLVKDYPATIVSNIFGVKIRFEGKNVWRSICRRGFTQVWDNTTLTPANCSTEVNLQLKSFNNILLIPETGINVLLIENLTDKFSLFRFNGATYSPAAATEVETRIRINFVDAGEAFNQLIIDSENASFEIRPL